ncbi:MAG: hypothetical protein VKJ02_13285 [Snowella sp.]|nr:hypothetical protein [Snowella sp.]
MKRLIFINLKKHLTPIVLAVFFAVSAWFASGIVNPDHVFIATAQAAIPGTAKNFNGSDRNANIKGIQSPNELPRDPSNLIDNSRYQLQDTVDTLKNTLNPNTDSSSRSSRLKEFSQNNSRRNTNDAVENFKEAITPNHGASARGQVRENGI